MKKLFIGTSGWAYPHWGKTFYPQTLTGKDKLRYYTNYFKTVEVNYSFYHLPSQKTFRNWAASVPDDFVFAIKASRYITHIKRLKGVKTAWRRFFKNAQALGKKLGPILVQLPPNFQATEENKKRLAGFLEFIKKDKTRFAFEFRHLSWAKKQIYYMLKKYKASWVIADSPSFPKREIVTADFIYIRFHGSKILFSSDYTLEELQDWARKIRKWLKKGDVYAYFNNDAKGFAPKNANQLQKLLSRH